MAVRLGGPEHSQERPAAVLAPAPRAGCGDALRLQGAVAEAALPQHIVVHVGRVCTQQRPARGRGAPTIAVRRSGVATRQACATRQPIIILRRGWL